jgi:hypothetical protein
MAAPSEAVFVGLRPDAWDTQLAPVGDTLAADS